MAIDLSADQDFATSGLARVEEELCRSDDRIETGLVMVGDEGLQRVRPNRQTQPGHGRHHRHLPAQSHHHQPGRNVAAFGLDSGDPVSAQLQASDSCVLVHLDPVLHRPFGQRPDHPIVPRGRASRVI